MQPRYNPQMMADIERKQALARMNPQTAPIAANDIVGNQMRNNNEAFMQARERGQDGAPMIEKAKNLAPLNFLENTVGMDTAQREAILGMPMPRADTGEGGFSRAGRSGAPRPYDPFAPGEGYKPKGKGDPFGPMPPRPKGFAMGGLVTNGPTMDELSQQTGGQPFSYSAQGPSQFSPFKNMLPDLGRRNAEGFAKFADGGPVIGPGGHKEDAIEAKLSHGEYVMPAEVVQFFGIDRLNKMVEKAKQGAAQQPMPEMKPDPMGTMGPMMPGYSKGGPVMPMMGMVPHYAEGGLNDIDTINRIGQAATRARIREQDAMLSPDPYGPTLNDSPVFQPMPRAAMMPTEAFQPDPEALADMRARRFLARSNEAAIPQPAPAPAPMPMMRGQQPPMMLAAPMPEPTMRPAPLTMTEKEQLMMPARAARTPMADPAFEAAMTGFTGMEKRRMRSQIGMEEAAFQRNQGREAIAMRAQDANAEKKRIQALQDSRDNMVIADQLRQAAENRQIGTNAAMSAAQDRQKQAEAAAAAEANRRFSPVLNADGTPIPGRMMNPQGQQLNTEPTRAEGIRMEPVPGLPGRVLPMMGGSRVPGLPMMQANTAPGPFREGLGRTTFTPVQETEAAKAPTVRKTAPRKGFSAEAPEWDYASLSDGSTRPITIDNPLPTQTKERFQHQYGRAPQTEQEWTEAWYLTTGQPMPAASGKPAASASAAPATRAKIKSMTPVT
jgi:hypothetical protein